MLQIKKTDVGPRKQKEPRRPPQILKVPVSCLGKEQKREELRGAS